LFTSDHIKIKILVFTQNEDLRRILFLQNVDYETLKIILKIFEVIISILLDYGLANRVDLMLQ